MSEVLFFDWRGTIEAELRALSAEKGVKFDVRQFATDWRSGMFEMLARVKTGKLPRMKRRYDSSART